MRRVQFIWIIFFLLRQLPAQDITYTLTNPRTETDVTGTYFLTDVLAYSHQGLKLGSGQLYFNYNPPAFGENVYTSGALALLMPAGSVLTRQVGPHPFSVDFYGNFRLNDNTASRFSFSWQHDYSAACLDTISVDHYAEIVCTIKLRYLPDSISVEHGVCLESAAVYSDQTFIPCGPLHCDAKDCMGHPGLRVLNDRYPCNDCRIVYSRENSGLGTLRDAINCAVAGDTIRFAPSLGMDTIVLTDNSLDIAKDLYVIARKHLGIAVGGSGIERVYHILSGNTVVIEGLKAIVGFSTEGGGVWNEGDLTLKDVQFIADPAYTGYAVRNNGVLIVEGAVDIVR